MKKIICPKCKTVVPFDTEKCPNCSMKLNIECPLCHTLNFVGYKNCTHCSTPLFVKCPECGATNYAESKSCRVCSTELKVENVNGNFSEITENSDVAGADDSIASEIQEEAPAVEPVSKSETDITEEISTDEPVFEKPENVENTQLSEPSPYEKSAREINEIIKAGEPVIEYFDSDGAIIDKIKLFIADTSLNVFALCGAKGCGKSTLVANCAASLPQNAYTVISAKIDSGIEYTPFLYIKNCLLNLLGLPSAHPDIKSFEAQSEKLFKKYFPLLDATELGLFENFLYPSMQDDFENIIDNKNKMFIVLEKVFDSIICIRPTIMIADDFELIDGASYDFINYLAQRQKFSSLFKLILVYRSENAVISYLDPDALNFVRSKTVCKKFKSSEDYFAKVLEISSIASAPDDIASVIVQNGSNDLSFGYMYVQSLLNCGFAAIENNALVKKSSAELFVPQNSSDIAKFMFESEQDAVLKNSLSAASVLGQKFNIHVLSKILNVADVQKILESALQKRFFYAINDTEFEFATFELFDIARQTALSSRDLPTLVQTTKNAIYGFTLASIGVSAITDEYIDDYSSALKVWKTLAAQTVKIGDDSLFVLIANRCFDIMSKMSHSDYSMFLDFKFELEENTVKLLYDKAPDMIYENLNSILSRAAQSGDDVKITEFCAYALKAHYASSNFVAVIQTIDFMLENLGTKLDELQIAVIKSKKVEALFKSGNCEQLANLVMNEILPVLEKALNSHEGQQSVQNTDVYDVFVNVCSILAKSYSLQGVNKASELLSKLEKIIASVKVTTEKQKLKFLTAKAFDAAVKGHVIECKNLLELLYANELVAKTPSLLTELNLISAYIGIITEEGRSLFAKVEEYKKQASFAGDTFSESVLNLFKAFLFTREKMYDDALKIVNGLLGYFAQNKIVTCALACWYLIAKISEFCDTGTDAISVANSALDIAGNANYKNVNFSILLKKVLAENMLAQNDFSNSASNLESAMQLAKQTGSEFVQIKLYENFVTQLKKTMLITEQNVQPGMDKVRKIFTLMLGLSKTAQIPGLENKIVQNLNDFRLFCVKNGFIEE